MPKDIRARLPQAGQQAGHAGRVVEGGVGGGVTGQQRGGLLLRARLPQAVQQKGHAGRVVEGGGAVGQLGDLVLRLRSPQAVQQPGHAVRVVQGGAVGGAVSGAVGQRGGLLLRARLDGPRAVPLLLGEAPRVGGMATVAVGSYSV